MVVRFDRLSVEVAVIRIDKKPVVDAHDRLVVGQRMVIGLSGDHRVVDGATAAQFLQALKLVLEDPTLMLI